MFNAVYMSEDGTKAFAGSGTSNAGIWSSSDKGVTWTQPFSEYMTGNYTYFTSNANDSGLFICKENEGIIHKMHAQTNINNSMTKRITGEFASVSLSLDGKTGIAINKSNGLWYSVNDGETWKKGETTISGDFKIYISDDGINAVLASNSDKGLWYSANRGQSWTQSLTNTTGSFNSITMSSDGTKLIAGSNSNTGLWYSVNKGETWTRSSWTESSTVTTTSGNFNAVSMSSDGTKAVAGSGSKNGVWYSTNGGQLWTKSWPNQGYSGAPSALTETSFSSIAISSDGTRVVAGEDVVLGAGFAKLWYSTNGGQNFLETATNNTSILSISMSSNGLIVLMGCSSGLRYSKDGGQTLITPSLSSADGDFKNVILSKDGKNAVALSFYTNGGLWYSINGCESWTKLSTYNDTKSIVTTLSGTYFNSLFNSISSNRDGSRIILGSNTNPNNGHIMNRGILYLDIGLAPQVGSVLLP